jgi:hypothetical protein
MRILAVEVSQGPWFDDGGPDGGMGGDGLHGAGRWTTPLL